MEARWLREELAGIYDRLNYLRREVKLYRGTDRLHHLRAPVVLEIERTRQMALRAVRVMDEEILGREQPTEVCPVCKMLARGETDENGTRWRVCDYCGASEPVEYPAEAAVVSSNLDDFLTERQADEAHGAGKAPVEDWAEIEGVSSDG